jgi:hypothetical protein
MNKNLSKFAKKAAGLEGRLAKIRKEGAEQAEEAFTAGVGLAATGVGGFVDEYLDDPTIGDTEITYSGAAGAACLVGYFFVPKKYRSKLLIASLGLSSGMVRAGGASLARSMKESK